MSNIAIRAEKLGKEYAIGHVRNRYPTLRDSMIHALRSPWLRLQNVLRGQAAWAHQETFWALKDVSFEIAEGNVVGIIGRNGAGKSTLLKVLSRITDPTDGYAELHGRVGSLLEVGTGFHPELTGRENIYMNGAMLGMRQREIQNRFADIVAFSEVDKFLDTPVKHYSSGMYTRLAFAVAAHLNPEILIVDEVLAVGDAAFQKKCLGKMDAVSREGRTVLFVSHTMSTIQNLCKTCIWLDQGQVRRVGPTAEIVADYLRYLTVVQNTPLDQRTDRQGSGNIRFLRLEILNEAGQKVPSLVTSEPATLVLVFENHSGKDLRHANFSIGIDDHLTNRITTLSQCMVPGPELIDSGVQAVAFRIPRLPLVPGKYGYTLFCSLNNIVADWVANAGEFYVEGGDFYGTGKLPSPGAGNVLLDYHFDARAA